MAKISIHTPAKGVTDPEGYQIYGLGISIHTPAKGVTDPEGYQIYGLGISIHTPAKGVTKCFRRIRTSATDFNPHSREGSDLLYFFNSSFPRISIHTPAKGVT